MIREKYYYETFGNDINIYKNAIKYACNLSKRDRKVSTIILYLITYKHDEYYQDIFGKSRAKRLKEGMMFQNCEAFIKYDTIKNLWKHIPNNKSSIIMISSGIDSKELIKLEDRHDIKSLIAIPFMEDNIDEWILKFNPTKL